MSSQPQWSAVDDETADLLALVAIGPLAPPTADAEWDHFVGALRLAAMRNDGLIRPNDLRPYVRNPLAAADPVFHLRRKCWGAAARYEEAWVATYPTAARSLLTLTCEGTVIVHEDGSGECFGAKDSDCPSIYARHRCMSACYIQSHGCGQGCTSRRHGTRLSGHPAHPRDVLTGGGAA